MPFPLFLSLLLLYWWVGLCSNDHRHQQSAISNWCRLALAVDHHTESPTKYKWPSQPATIHTLAWHLEISRAFSKSPISRRQRWIVANPKLAQIMNAEISPDRNRQYCADGQFERQGWIPTTNKPNQVSKPFPMRSLTVWLGNHITVFT